MYSPMNIVSINKIVLNNKFYTKQKLNVSFFPLTYGKSNICPYEWNERYNLILSKLFTNCDNANVSGSENGFAPANISEHGFFDAPFSVNEKFNFILEKYFK